MVTFSEEKVLFHHDNAQTHLSAITTTELVVLHCELLPHPLYSPGLAPFDFSLFPNMKKWLGGKQFISNKEELITKTEAYFADSDKSYFLKGLKKF